MRVLHEREPYVLHHLLYDDEGRIAGITLEHETYGVKVALAGSELESFLRERNESGTEGGDEGDS